MTPGNNNNKIWDEKRKSFTQNDFITIDRKDSLIVFTCRCNRCPLSRVDSVDTFTVITFTPESDVQILYRRKPLRRKTKCGS